MGCPRLRHEEPSTRVNMLLAETSKFYRRTKNMTLRHLSKLCFVLGEFLVCLLNLCFNV